MPPLTLSEQGILLAKQSYRMVLARRSPHGAFITRNFFSSPLYRLFARHAERPSVRHLLLRKSRRPFPSNYNPTPNLTSPASTGSAGPVSSSGVISGKSLSFSQRLRKLSREYGWSAFGVYMALSALDFPFCFLAVRWLGTERIGRWEHAIVEWFKRAIPLQLPEKWGGKVRNEKEAEVTEQESLAYDHGVKKAEQANSGESASKYHGKEYPHDRKLIITQASGRNSLWLTPSTRASSSSECRSLQLSRRRWSRP